MLAIEEIAGRQSRGGYRYEDRNMSNGGRFTNTRFIRGFQSGGLHIH